MEGTDFTGSEWLVKMTNRTFSTEADALRFLNSVSPPLPIPRLIDSFQFEGKTFTIMTKLPGESLASIDSSQGEGLTPEKRNFIMDQVLSVISQLQSLTQPVDFGGKSMISAAKQPLRDITIARPINVRRWPDDWRRPSVPSSVSTPTTNASTPSVIIASTWVGEEASEASSRGATLCEVRHPGSADIEHVA